MIYIKLCDAVIAGTFLTSALDIESIIGTIDYDMDAMDPITVQIGSFVIIDYKFDGIDVIRIIIDVYVIIDCKFDGIDVIRIIMDVSCRWYISTASLFSTKVINMITMHLISCFVNVLQFNCIANEMYIELEHIFKTMLIGDGYVHKR